MIDHLSIQCENVAASAAFYDQALAPLGIVRVMQFGDIIAYGIGRQPTFWIGPLNLGGANREVHIAFAAPDRAAVDRFFRAALDAGAEPLHEPRLWPEYHEHYYGAFVRDLDDNNIEAVCHLPAGQPAGT